MSEQPACKDCGAQYHHTAAECIANLKAELIKTRMVTRELAQTLSLEELQGVSKLAAEWIANHFQLTAGALAEKGS